MKRPATGRPILFSGPMVRALLAGTKTQTRRAVKPQPKSGWRAEPWNDMDNGPSILYSRPACLEGEFTDAVRCPYGRPGDQLWVRETFGIYDEKAERDKDRGYVFYRADDERKHETDGLWKPSIFMPRWASRITLEVTGIRAERLHAITQENARAEGMPADVANSPRVWYMALWNSINGAGSWERNPWVWVVEFKTWNTESGHK